MSKSIKVQLSKTLYINKIETLQKSYNSLKSILSPNLSENNNSFMSYLLELIISQIKFFISILNLNNDKKLYEMLNTNNQNLSKQISALYEIPKFKASQKLTLNTTSEKKQNDNNLIYNNKENYSLEEKKETIEQKNNDNFEFNFNINTESKVVDNDDLFDSKNKEENKTNSQYKENKDKLIKINDVEKEKNAIVRNINFESENKTYNNFKEKDKFKKVKSQNKITKKLIQKRENKDNENKLKFKRKYVFSNKKPKNSLTNFKLKGYESPLFNIESKMNKNFSKKGLNQLKERIREKSYNKTARKNIKDDKKDKIEKENKIKLNFLKDNNIDEKSNKENDKIEENIQRTTHKNVKFKRKGRKAKTVLFKTIQLPYFIGIETSDNDIYPDDNYISITFSNQVLNEVKTPNNSNRNNKNINFKAFSGKKLDTEFKKEKNLNINTSDYFSLDEFLIPSTGKNGEKLYLTKKGKVLLNKKQKDILEDYVNNYLYDENDSKSSYTETDKGEYTNQNIKDKIMKKNKKYYIKGTSMHYNLKDVTEVLQMLPKSFKVPIDDFYLRKKRASMFDRGIFKICHKVIDNYKILEGKEDIFQFKKSKSKSKYNIHHKHNKLK